MNPMTNMKNVLKLSEQELKFGMKTSWHDQYKHSAWIFIGGLPYDLTEGDVICVFSQYGEVVNINLVRDKATGKSRGFCFICYEDQRSTNLAVDNLNGIKLLNRTIRVDHCEGYKAPKDDKMDEETRQLHVEGCAPGSKYGNAPQLPSASQGRNGGLDQGLNLPPMESLLKIKPEKEDVPMKKKEKKGKKDKKVKNEIKKLFKKKQVDNSSSESSSSDSSSESDNKNSKKKKQKKVKKRKRKDSTSSEESESDMEDREEKQRKEESRKAKEDTLVSNRGNIGKYQRGKDGPVPIKQERDFDRSMRDERTSGPERKGHDSMQRSHYSRNDRRDFSDRRDSSQSWGDGDQKISRGKTKEDSRYGNDHRNRDERDVRNLDYRVKENRYDSDRKNRDERRDKRRSDDRGQR